MKRKIIFILILSMTVASCSNNLVKSDSNSTRTIASNTEDYLASCIEGLASELDPSAISEKFTVETNAADSASSEAAKASCEAKIAAFGTKCNIRYYEPWGQGKYVATPYLDENFLKKYRQYLLCNSIATCEMRASLNESINSNTFDKIHRVYKNNKCDSISTPSDIAKNKIKQPKAEQSQKMPKECLMTDTSDEYCNHNPEFCDRRGVMPTHCDQYYTNGENKTSGIAIPSSRVTEEPTITRASREPQKDPNAQACHLRSGQQKCQELSGVCEWVYPSAGFCKAREGSKDPNAQACHLRSGQRKCEELSGVCAWNGQSAGYCKAR